MTDARDPLIPHRDWRLGQRGWLTAGLLWGAFAAVLWASMLFAAMLLPALGSPPRDDLLIGVVLALLLAASSAVVAFVRTLAASRQAWYGRTSERLRARHPWARVRVREPWMRVLGMRVLTGRKGLVALTEDRAVLVVRRIHPALVGIGLVLSFAGGLVGALQPMAVYPAGGLVLGCVVLSFFTGADVHEIRYDDIEHAHAGEGRVQWVQRGADAPRVVRFRVLNATDPGAASVWLTGTRESGVEPA